MRDRTQPCPSSSSPCSDVPGPPVSLGHRGGLVTPCQADATLSVSASAQAQIRAVEHQPFISVSSRPLWEEQRCPWLLPPAVHHHCPRPETEGTQASEHEQRRPLFGPASGGSALFQGGGWDAVWPREGGIMGSGDRKDQDREERQGTNKQGRYKEGACTTEPGFGGGKRGRLPAGAGSCGSAMAGAGVGNRRVEGSLSCGGTRARWGLKLVPSRNQKQVCW